MISSGRWKVFVSFNLYPMAVTICHDDKLMMKCNASELITLRAVIKKAIKKAQQCAPSDEDKETDKAFDKLKHGNV